MMTRPRFEKSVAQIAAIAAVLALPPSLCAQQDDDATWSATAELSAVATDGNSQTRTFGFKGKLERRFEAGGIKLRVEGLQARSAPQRFAERTPPGGGAEAFVVVTPPTESDAEKYLLAGRYDREISERLRWHLGAGWDRSLDAGILSRVQVFAGVGHQWLDTEKTSFETQYSFSYTRVDEETPGPDESFPGLRLDLEFERQLSESARYSNTSSLNWSLEDTADYYYDTVNAVGVALTGRLALQVSVQWLFESRPALERLALLSSGAVVGSVLVPKERLDTILNTSLVIRW